MDNNQTYSLKLDKKIIKKYKKKYKILRKSLCKAPFTNLYFTPDGYIKACCAHEKEYAYGKYPEKKLSEIINSGKREELQKSLKTHDYSKGCRACYRDLVSGNFEAAMLSQYHRYRIRKWPQVLQFELSHYCNLDCIMCYLHCDNKNDNVYDDKFIEELSPFISKAKEANFFGGEPFVIPIYQKIWDKIAKLNPKMKIYIQTNGTIFNDYVENLLKKYNISLGISIDAMHKELYEKIRKGADFDKLMKNIQKFDEIIKAKSDTMYYSFNPMPINWQEIPDFIDFVNRKKSILFFNTVELPKKYSLNSLDISNLTNIIDFLNEYSPKKFSNPHFKKNNLKFQNLLTSLISILEVKQKYKGYYSSVPFYKLFDIFPEIFKPKLVNLLIKKLDERQMNTIITPEQQYELKNTEEYKIINGIEKIISQNDITPLINYFKIDN